MEKVACKYALVRYCPCSISEEFANVGVVLQEGDKASSPTFMYAMAHWDWEMQWVVDFFQGRISPARTRAELRELHRQIQYAAHTVSFDEYVIPRGGMFVFSNLRAVLTPDPHAEMMKLYQYHTLSHTHGYF